MLAAVRLIEVLDRSEGDDAVRIDVVMRHVVMPLDVVEVHRFGDAGPLIQVAGVAGQVRVVGNAAQVALEMAMVDRVEPDEGACDDRPRRGTRNR